MKKIQNEIDFLLYTNRSIKEEIEHKYDNPKMNLIEYLSKIDEFLSLVFEEKEKLYDLFESIKEKYIIKKIPDCYTKYSKKYVQELGYYKETGIGGFETKLTDEQYKDVLIHIRQEQLDSVIPWIEFLCNRIRKYPIWFRYYIFNRVMKIGAKYSNIGSMTKRSKLTTEPFIECDYEVLDRIYDVISRFIHEEELTDEEITIMNNNFSFKDIYFYCENLTKKKGRIC